MKANGSIFVHSFLLNQMKGGIYMGTIIAKNIVNRKPGFLYYVDGKGNVCEAKMARGGKRKKKVAKKKK